MKDIEGAIKLEEKYIQYRMDDKEPFSLEDEIKKYGFDNLKQYFDEKLNFQISQLSFSVKEVVPFTAAEAMLNLMKTKTNGILLMNTDQTVVYHGSKDFNRQYCEENNIPIIEHYSNGGTLVASDGELSIGICMPFFNGLSGEYILLKLKEILDKYYNHNEVVIDNNDLMIDGKKVCGTTVYPTSEIFGFLAQFSFDDKSELISKICYPSESGSEKTAGYIDKLTREELRKEVLEWLL